MRGMKKYRPFNSIPGLNKLIYDIEEEKEKIDFPVLSEDLIEKINFDLIYSYKNKNYLTIYYYKNGYKLSINGIIETLNKDYLIINKKRITLNVILNTSV